MVRNGARGAAGWRRSQAGDGFAGGMDAPGRSTRAVTAWPGYAGHGAHGTEFAVGRRHGNDSTIKAASDDRDRLLTTKLKSICRGC